MNIKIDKMILRNFKGIKSLEINADGESLNIYGDNATGKTTVFDAVTWLLFGKDSLGRSDFEIKTLDESGNAIHNLEHSVECTFNIDDAILQLKKVYAEKWTKKRGSAEAEFTGHETKYFVNEVPSTKKEYEGKISSIINEELFKVITNPLYFNEHLKWQERRSMLINLCGEITDEELITSNPTFAVLHEKLKGRTVAEYKKIIQSQQAAINDNLKTIPQRISEATLAIPETVSEVDENAKAICEQKIADINDKINALKNGAGIAKLKTDIQILKEREKELTTKKCDISALENQINSIKVKISDAQSIISNCNQSISSAEYIIEEHERKADALRKQWHSVNDKVYSDNGICPTCGQPLPPEQIEAAKTKFNTEKVEQLESITELGKKAKAVCETNLAERQKHIEKMNDMQILIDGEYKPEIDRLTALIVEKTHDFESNKSIEITYIQNNIAKLEKQCASGAESIQGSIDMLNAEIAAENAKIAEINKAIAGRELAERQRQRIEELESDEKRLASEYAELDKTSYLIDEFIKFKIKILSERINDLFKFTKFKLFEIQINGGVAECCEATYKGVPYSDLNNAGRINIGLDIINTLCEANGKNAPVIIDNAESVTDILPTTSQQICLIVSADDDMLRVEKRGYNG